MGCDIHGWVEEYVGDRWVGVKEITPVGRSRNYSRFAALAGVRGNGPEPVGIPADVSDTVRYWIDSWGSDGHSHSWLPMNMAEDTWAQTGPVDKSNIEPQFHYFGLFDLENKHRRRVVFWFDN